MTNPVTLDDLKAAIDALPDPLSTSPDAWYPLDLRARAKAWRMAFEWRDRIHHRYRAVDVFSNAWEEIDKEHGEGMRLIREKLQS